MNKKQFILTIVFCIYLSICFLNFANVIMGEFYDRCHADGMIINRLQEWIFEMMITVYSFFVITIIIGLFAYWFRHFNLWIYVIFGFLMRTVIMIIIFPLLIKKSQMISFLFYEHKVFLLVQFILTFLSSCLVYNYVTKIDYIDKKDKIDFTFWGLSKSFWFLITIAFSPILNFLIKYSFVSIYDVTKIVEIKKVSWADLLKNIFISVYTGDIYKPLIVVLTNWVIWGLSIVTFYIAIEAVRNTATKYRKIKIVGILVILPILILVLPVIKSKPWFF